MWFERTRLQELNTAVQTGRHDEIDRLLEQIFEADRAASEAPATCPTCGRPLVESALPDHQVPASACPSSHGVWLTRAAVDRLRQASPPATPSVVPSRLLPAVWAAALSGVITIGWLTGAFHWPGSGGDAPGPVQAERPARPSSQPEPHLAPLKNNDIDMTVSPTHWPRRVWPGIAPIPVKASVVDRHDELAYLDEVFGLLEEGISNRLNVDGALRTGRPAAEYSALLDTYRDRQGLFLSRLRAMRAPARLASFHRRLIVATEEQIAFYAAFVEAKLADPTTDLRRMLRHPALERQNAELHTAYDEVRQLYPNLDPGTHQALYSHLCGFDII